MMRRLSYKSGSSVARLTALRRVCVRSVSFALFIFFFGLFANNAAFSAQQHYRRIPPPPIKLVSLSKLEPARDVPAEKWLAHYCLAWNDGCTRCERSELKPWSKVSCIPIAANEGCAPTFSICSKPAPQFFDQTCRAPVKVYFQRSDFDAKRETAESFLRRDGAVSRDIDASRHWQFELERRDTWSVFVTDNIHRYGERHLALRREGEVGHYCDEAFSRKDVDDAIRSAREEIGANGHGHLWAERQPKKR